jgi:hypothetical protein
MLCSVPAIILSEMLGNPLLFYKRQNIAAGYAIEFRACGIPMMV